jgi:CDP-glucose 4,6-dehydratase
MVKNFWKERTVLVTGATGMVGSNIVHKLLDFGSQVVVTSRSTNRNSYFYSERLDEKAIVVNCDIKDFQRLRDITSRYGISVVFHLAAQTLVTVAKKEPYETLMTNIAGTINVLEACRNNPDIEAVLLASSDKAYGSSNVLPYLETFPLKGDYPYDVSKSCMDLISQSYFKTFQLPLAIARFGNIYGEGDLNFDRIIPGAIKSGLMNSVLRIRSDGKMVREYLYVKDVVNGYLSLAENIEKIKGEAFNFTSGKKMNVFDVVKAVGNAMKKRINYQILGTAKCEINEQYLNAEKSERMLRWKCQYEMESVLPNVIDWYKDYLKSTHKLQ